MFITSHRIVTTFPARLSIVAAKLSSLAGKLDKIPWDLEFLVKVFLQLTALIN